MPVLVPRTPGPIVPSRRQRPGSTEDLEGQLSELQANLKALQIRPQLTSKEQAGNETRMRELEMKIASVKSDLEVKLRDSDRTARMQRHVLDEDPANRLPKSLAKRHFGRGSGIDIRL